MQGDGPPYRELGAPVGLLAVLCPPHKTHRSHRMLALLLLGTSAPQRRRLPRAHFRSALVSIGTRGCSTRREKLQGPAPPACKPSTRTGGRSIGFIPRAAPISDPRRLLWPRPTPLHSRSLVPLQRPLPATSASFPRAMRRGPPLFGILPSHLWPLPTATRRWGKTSPLHPLRSLLCVRNLSSAARQRR